MAPRKLPKRQSNLRGLQATCTVLRSASYPVAHVQIAGKAISVSTSYMYSSPATCELETLANCLRKVLHNVLKAPERLEYQLAFLSSVSPGSVREYHIVTDHGQILKELHEIFAGAPARASSDTSGSSDGNRKEVSGDCPICFTEFEPETEDIVWCRAACGNNLHKDCFEQWARSQAGKEIRCVYW